MIHTTNIVNDEPLVWGSCAKALSYSYVVKIHYFFKNLLLYFNAQIKQPEGILIMPKEGTTTIVNFMTQGMDSAARVWSNKSSSENALFFKNLLLFNQA